jgi:uncharacterized membrane protein
MRGAPGGIIGLIILVVIIIVVLRGFCLTPQKGAVGGNRPALSQRKTQTLIISTLQCALGEGMPV